MHIIYDKRNSPVIAGYTAEFNGSFHYLEVKDRPHYAFAAETAHLTCGDMVRVHQRHTDRVLAVDGNNRGEGVVRDGTDESYDAMVTGTEGLMLCIVTADCVPVFLFDENAGVIGLAHSGRAGTMQEIAAKTSVKMQEQFGAVPKDIRCFLGPYLCPDHHEVQEKDIRGFSAAFSAGEQSRFLIASGGRYHVDMGTAIRISLMRTGIPKENIADDRVCTFEDRALPSWRREHNPDSHILSFIALKKKGL